MPSYGETQQPAGVDKSPAMKPLGKRTMVSRDRLVKSNLSIDNCEYKGNEDLNANRSLL